MTHALRRPLPLVLPLVLMSLVLAGCAATGDPARREARTLGGNVRQITRGFTDATDPALSPDGQWLAFRGVPLGEEQSQLFLARALYDGAAGKPGRGDLIGVGQPIRVTPPGSRNAAPVFGPDGQSLLFVSTALVDGEATKRDPALLDFERYADVFRADGYERNLAAADPRAGVNLAQHKVAARPGYDGEPAYTPDGRHVLFASDRDAPASARDTRELIDLYAMRPDGTNVVRLTADAGRDGQPSVAPDGRTVVFCSDRAAPGRFDLYRLTLVFDAAGRVVGATPAERLTQDKGATQPCVLAGGEWAVYTSASDDRRGMGNTELHLLRLSGSGEDVRLTFDPAADDAPRFDRAGDLLLFSSRRTPDGSRQVFVTPFEVP